MNKNKHIIISVGYYPPDHTGAGLRLHCMYRRVMQILPLDVTVLARSGRRETEGWQLRGGVDVYRTPPINSKVQAISEVSKFFLSAWSRGFDALHATGSFRTVVCSCLWARLLGIPILRESAMSGTITQAGGLSESALRWSFKMADITVARTTKEMQKLDSIGVEQSRIYRASYPVEDRTFDIPTSTQRGEARNHLGLRRTAKVHLIVGKLCPRKNQRFGVHVLSELPEDHRLLLAGPPDGNYPSQLCREARKLGVKNRLKIVDEYVSELTPYYWAADTLWIPSRSEGVPNVMKEALICGVPVVMNAALDLQDQVAEDDGVFHAPLETEEFLQVVETVVNRFEVPSAQIHEVGQQRFGVSGWGKDFSEMLAELVGLQRVENSG